MLIIPAIDLRNNKVVRLFQGKYNQTKIYGDDPIKYALFFEKEGAKRIHIVDLDGAKEGKPVHKNLIVEITKCVKIPIQVGGGIRDRETVEFYLQKGVSQIILGTKAVTSWDWLEEISNDFPYKIIVSVDVKGEKVAISGWLKISEIIYLDFIKKLNNLKLFAIVLTFTEKDGTQQGIETERLEKALNISKHPIIAAGGVSSVDDIKKLKIYEKNGLLGVIVGKAIYEGSLNLKEAFQMINGS